MAPNVEEELQHSGGCCSLERLQHYCQHTRGRTLPLPVQIRGLGRDNRSRCSLRLPARHEPVRTPVNSGCNSLRALRCAAVGKVSLCMWEEAQEQPKMDQCMFGSLCRCSHMYMHVRLLGEGHSAPWRRPEAAQNGLL